MLNKYPYIYDIFAGVITMVILILSGKLERGNIVPLNITGIMLLLIAAVLWILPIPHFQKYGKVAKGKKYFESTSLVQGGIFSIVRHPQYLSYMLLVSGFALLSQNWIIITLAITAVSLFFAHTLQEEEELINRFGNDYINYKNKVPRFNLIAGILKKFFHRDAGEL